MTVQQMANAGINRFRRSMWASQAAYVKIDIFNQNGKFLYGPWYSLYDRASQELINAPTPQKVCNLGDETDDYEPYLGPIDKDDILARIEE